MDLVDRGGTVGDNARAIPNQSVSLIAEDIQFIDRRLRKSQYFYIDIKREGIVLYDSGRFELAEPNELDKQERKKLAEEDFEYWLENAVEFFEYYEIAIDKKHYKKAAFYLHQATECFYSTILLVFTRYKPSSHDLEILSQRVTGMEPRFLTVFSQGTEEEKSRFRLLRKAYVDARYKPSYRITRDDLEWLGERVRMLLSLTEKLCREKIERFG